MDKREVEMAQALIDKLYGPFEPEQYEDTYRDTLCEIIKASARARRSRRPSPSKPKAAPDLMAALKASLEQAAAGKPKIEAANGGQRRSPGRGERRPRPRR